MFKKTLKIFNQDNKNVYLIAVPLFLFLFASELNFISQLSIVIRKICFNQFQNLSICDKLHKNDTLEHEVQKIANEWNLWMNIAFIVPAIFAILYLSSITDKSKSFVNMILIATFGYILQALICVITSTKKLIRH